MQSLITRKLTADIWARMMPGEKEKLRVKAKSATSFSDPKSLDISSRWDEYWGEEKRALIRAYRELE